MPIPTPDPIAAERAALAAAERAVITAAIAACAGNRTRAAELLDVSTRTLARRIVELGLVSTLDALALEKGWASAPGSAARALRGKLNARRA